MLLKRQSKSCLNAELPGKSSRDADTLHHQLKAGNDTKDQAEADTLKKDGRATSSNLRSHGDAQAQPRTDDKPQSLTQALTTSAASSKPPNTKPISTA